jgi:hypothetical protein
MYAVVRRGRLQVDQFRQWCCLFLKPAEQLGSESRAHESGDGQPIPIRRLLNSAHSGACQLWRNHMPQRKHSPKPNTAPVARVVEPNAAGIDIGATET